MHYLLIYELSDDYIQRRPAHRDEHLAMAWAAHETGGLVLAGALADPTDKAVLLFTGDSPEAAKAFAEADPYVRHGLVKNWQVRPWTTVVGEEAAQPIHAEQPSD